MLVIRRMAEVGVFASLINPTMLGSAVVMQGLSAGINSFMQVKEDRANDQEICNQITQSQSSITKMQALLDKTAQGTAIASLTSSEIDDLITTSRGETVKLGSMQKTFTIRLMITIILNIVLTLIVAIQLLS